MSIGNEQELVPPKTKPAHYGLPLWCDEGLRQGPDSWPSVGRTIPLSGMGGVVVAAAWDRI